MVWGRKEGVPGRGEPPAVQGAKNFWVPGPPTTTFEGRQGRKIKSKKAKGKREKNIEYPTPNIEL